LKNLKLLTNGKYQYRRSWPEDVRKARPELGRELKRTFDIDVGRDQAIVQATLLNRDFERVRRSIRENGGAIPTWETAEKVGLWLEENRSTFNAVVYEGVGYDKYGNEVVVQETAGDLEIERILEEAAKRCGRDFEGDPAELTVEERLKIEGLSKGRVSAPELTVRSAFNLYTAKKKGGKVHRQTNTAVNQLIEYCGDIPLRNLTSAKIMDWLDYLVDERDQSYESVKKRNSSMKAVVNFAKKRGAYEGANPFEGQRPPERARRSEDRLPFNKIHLEAIDHYLATSNVQDETRWVVTLLKYTGCRPSEIGGLRAEDLSLDGDIPFLLVRWTEDRRLKTNDSERRVPLVGEALEAARNAHKRHPKGWLFPKLAPSSAELNDNAALSARINKVIRSAGIYKSTQLVSYSFRHTMAVALDQTPGIAHAVRERVLGRKKAQYGATEQPLAESKAALEAAIQRLGNTDKVLYKPEMLETRSS